ncbi:MAG: hypothetical protein QOE40_938 [Actinomycetota bacterium]|jgi:PAS domain S-box-containing protein|nr:hypothetical protein [Actinomycetota bacterium]
MKRRGSHVGHAFAPDAESINATMRLLLLVVAVDAVLSMSVGFGGFLALAHGHRDWPSLLAAASVLWPVVLGVALVRGRRAAAWVRTRLADGADRLAAVSSMSHVGVWEATPDMVATYCGPMAAESLGRTPDQLVGHSLYDLLHPDDLPRARAIVTDAVRRGTGWTDVELRWRHTDGTVLTMHSSGQAVLDGHGEVVALRGTRRALTDPVTQRRKAAATALTREVLDGEGLTIALQPIVDIHAGRWVGVEALARFADGRPPDAAFADARDAGLGVELEKLALCRALSTLADLPAGIRLSVNASPDLILDAGLAELFTASGVPLHRITVEITEHRPVACYDDVLAALRPLREQGLHLAVDDTGAGYASFQHVLRLRPESIKLDRSLLSEITTDRARRSLVTAIVLLALDLGATVVAEGVEDEAELRALADLGVHLAQGYLLARPATDAAVQASWARLDWRPALPSAM